MVVICSEICKIIVKSVNIMKRLILIQNDYPSTGKSTLACCFHRYLHQFGVAHQTLRLVDDSFTIDDDGTCLDANKLTPFEFLDHVDASPITILEVGTGLGEFFGKFYQNHELDQVLPEADVALSVVLPVTSESDSFDSVIEAAETYSDNAEYLIAHLITSSYEDDDKVWDSSYAARVMDMFEAIELHVPEIGFQTELELRAQHTDLATALNDADAEDNYGKDFGRWLRRAMGQVESARQFLFGDAFKPTTMPKAFKQPARRGRPRVKAD